MPPKIRISIDKIGVPPGMVLLEDDSALSSAMHDSLARLIQRQLGFPWRAKLRQEAKNLTRVALAGVDTGSGVLVYEGLPPAGVAGRFPSAIAAFDLVHGISTFSESHVWPAYLPAIVRNRIGAAMATVLSDDKSRIEIDVEENGYRAHCEIGATVRRALLEPDTFSADSPISVVGKIIDLNIKNYSFKIELPARSITVEVDEQQFLRADADEMRWGRIYVSGYPQDEKCRAIHRVEELRVATDDEEDGIVVANERRRGERTDTYQLAYERAQHLQRLTSDWDTYGGQPPGKRTVVYALHFLRDAIGVLLDHGIEVPPPFLVPTASGGVQYEWQIADRELELEIPEKGRFEFLATNGKEEREGSASRWTAMRLLRWVITGEEV